MKHTTFTNLRNLVLGALMLAASSVFAQEQKPYAKNGFYLGIAAPRNEIAGSFDGETVLTGGGELIAVPKVASSFGLGVLVGGRTGQSALEVGYLRSRHNVTFLEAPGKADYHVLNFDARYYLTAKSAAQPFVLLGATLDWLIVEEGSVSETEVGDATFQGGGFYAGGGLAIYLHPRVSISGEAAYRLIGYGGEHSVKGVMNEWTGISNEDFSGGGMSFALGVRVTF